MLMKTKSSQPLLNDQRGLASFLITIFLMVILGLIVLGFAQFTRRDQRQALDRQLSTQAKNAAESGINDVYKYITTPSTSPNYEKKDCDETAAGELIPGYKKQLSPTDSSVLYTCALVDPTPDSIQSDGVDFNSNSTFQVKSKSGSVVQSITLTWGAQDSTSNPTAQDCPQQSDPATNRFPQSRDADCRIPVLRADIVPYNASTSSKDGLVRGQYTVFGLPSTAGATQIAYVALPGDNTNSPSVTCSGNVCKLTVTGVNSALTYIRLNAIYGLANVTITASDDAADVNKKIELVGAQAIIDVTGQATDVVRRIQVRVALGAREQIPGFALQTSSSQCKRLAVIPNSSSSLISPGVAGGLCDPTSSSTTEP